MFGTPKTFLVCLLLAAAAVGLTLRSASAAELEKHMGIAGTQYHDVLICAKSDMIEDLVKAAVDKEVYGMVLGMFSSTGQCRLYADDVTLAMPIGLPSKDFEKDIVEAWVVIDALGNVGFALIFPEMEALKSGQEI